MVLCGVVVEEKQQHKLEEIGAKDSKQLTKKQRESLLKKIKDTAKSHYIIIVEPKEIDEALESNSLNLNKLEAVKMAEIINYLRPDKVIIDCPSNNIKQFVIYVKKHLIHKKVEIKAEHKADANYPLVGAASILAKVTRDAEIEKIKKRIGIEFGSGYPADPKTDKFLKENFEKYPEIFRKTWASHKRLVKGLGQSKLDGF